MSTITTIEDIRDALENAHENVTRLAIYLRDGHGVSFAEIIDAAELISLAKWTLREFTSFPTVDTDGNKGVSAEWKNVFLKANLRAVGSYDVDTEHDVAIADNAALDVVESASHCVYTLLYEDCDETIDTCAARLVDMVENGNGIQETISNALGAQQGEAFVELLAAMPISPSARFVSRERRVQFEFLDLAREFSRKIRRY